MANLTPSTGNFTMFLPVGGGAEDNSLESAIRLTIASGVRPTRIQNFGSLISNIPSYDLIHDSFGTKGGVPNNMGQLRGYPKPTCFLDIEVLTIGTYPSMTYQKLVCEPVLNQIVGFALTLSVVVVEVDPTDGISTHTETFTFNKGVTTVSSSTLTADGDGKYRLDTSFPQPTNIENLAIQVDTYTTTSDAYKSNVTPYTTGDIEFITSLTYTGATTVYSRTWFDYSQVGCGGTPSGAGFTVYTVASPQTGGNVDPRWAVNSKFYTDATLTTLLAAGNYAATDTAWVLYDSYVIGINGNLDSRVIDCT